MSPSIEENVDVVRQGYDRINRVGPDGARDFMDPDIVLEMPEGVLDAGSYHGREATMRVASRSTGSAGGSTRCTTDSSSAPSSASMRASPSKRWGVLLLRRPRPTPGRGDHPQPVLFPQLEHV
jgi:hypothetical protein